LRIVISLLVLTFSLLFLEKHVYAQNIKKQVWHDLAKTQLKEEYFLNNKNKKSIDGLFTSFYLNGKVKMKGYFVQNQHHGLWEFYYENGNKKSEGYYGKNLPEGIWKYYYENQNLQMQGKLWKGKKDSTWTFYYEDQTIKSIGDYDKGEITGQWKYFYEDGKIKGDALLVNNSGWYREYFVDGQLKMEGLLKAGLSDSTWLYYHENGVLKAQGTERFGLKEGYWMYYHDNKVVSAQGNYVNGVQVGSWKYYYPNSQLSSQGEMAAGRKDGKWLSYYEIGSLKGESTFNNGDGPYKEYFPNGKLRIEGFVKQEKNHGLWQYYYDNGALEARCDFKECEGWYTGYFPNGKLRMEGKIKDGNKIGSWKLYDDEEALAGYYKTYYDKEAEKITGDTINIKDTVILKMTPKKDLEVVQKKKKRKPTRFFNPSLNQYNTTILSCNPAALMRGSLPVYVEYYMEEKMGLELNYTIYRIPFFGNPESQGTDKLFSTGFALGLKQRFYKKMSSYGMLYYGHELKYQELQYTAYVNSLTGNTILLSADADVYQYTFQIGDRLLKATDKPGFTMDFFVGLGVGIKQYSEQLDGQTKSANLFSGVRKAGFFIPVQLGFSFGYIL
jgi:antitoxin component YwqK of YwqJK toxin-antitoxin module